MGNPYTLCAKTCKNIFCNLLIFSWLVNFLPIILHTKVSLPHLCELLRNHRLESLYHLDTGTTDRATLMGLLGKAFRKWCKDQKVEIPPCTWNLHFLGRGDNDKRTYPELDSNVKAAHCKPILFFLSGVFKEISQLCPTCILEIIIFFTYIVKIYVSSCLLHFLGFATARYPRQGMLFEGSMPMGGLPIFVGDRSTSDSTWGRPSETSSPCWAYMSPVLWGIGQSEF